MNVVQKIKAVIMVSLFIIIPAHSLFAQNFVYDNGTDIVEKGVQQNFLGCQLDFTTPQPEDITFQFKVIDSDIPSDWFFSLCGYGTCYVGLPNSGEFNKISKTEMEAGQKAFFTLSANPSTYERAYVQIYVYEKGNLSRGDTVSLTIINQEVAGVSTTISNSISCYPNPATDKLNITLPIPNQNLDFSLVNTIGQIVTPPVIKNGAITVMDVSAVEPGYYFLNIKKEDELIGVKKVSVL